MRSELHSERLKQYTPELFGIGSPGPATPRPAPRPLRLDLAQARERRDVLSPLRIELVIRPYFR
eukprot:4743924-Alexandrium_andersonii.AAC.1